ncbi:MAG TPA: glucose-6-phosphate isomerase [Candidatus Magasanikbacteria bacterium]|nr:MAG: hypothetical protein A3I74_04625 [Candidatus Magasanikbacteria bacterium RIFCSPLOWO2_02_FULL_47_16]OGH79490.1 MAG: hypothetical protein A3C10_01595 [Candidatus Magasanikbacteria bacterium RIFCSPHIGHO2_02_FULL_48_18]OGH83164.1 MAG: hypothetical protein A3G08_04565 [Candidatus Magasanikbacteria bacterium RIFCSPLOWO2_12_FULL_47_9b]HAZ28839.1 glucose-6-phosphate isomerase [Candidatus Magasanikbacteria bacterium]
MLSIDFSNLFRVEPSHGLQKKELAKTKKFLKPFLKQFHGRGQHFHEMLDDAKSIKDILDFAKKNRGCYDAIVICGIGGSALGARCLAESLGHLFSHERVQQKIPRLYVLDNIDPVLILEIQEIIDFKKTLFLVISKSGETPEVVSQFFYVTNLLQKKKLDIREHVLFITDPQKGLLRQIAKQTELPAIDHADVGGRFSVLSSVGLVPAALLGIDIQKILAGARDMRDRFFSLSFEKNYPFQLAAAQYLLFHKGKNIVVMMPYAQKLARFSEWYSQLLAESIGKEKDRSSNVVHAGLTPVSALGTTDQHSQIQLYMEGPNDKLVMFLSVRSLAKTVPIPCRFSKEPALQYLRGASFNALLDAEQKGTSMALTRHDRPNLTITIDRIDPFHLGQLLFLFEGSVAFLGEFFDVDAYSQPGVELGKKLTKDLLFKKNKEL